MTDAYPNGLIAWADVAYLEGEASKRFYGGLFGWESTDVTTDMGPVYTMFTLGGKNVAGGGQMPPDQTEQGIPPMWSTYINVDDVDEVLAKVTDNGGQVLMPAMDVMTSGRMAFIMDPAGAAIGLWQPRDHKGADHFNDPGFMSWNELQTRDVGAAIAFYSAILPWNIVTQDFDGFTYHVIMVEGRDMPNGGMLQMDENFPPEVPPNWSVCFRVDDADAAAARIAELGGKVMMPPWETQFGRMGVAADNQGAVFTFIGPTPEQTS